MMAFAIILRRLYFCLVQKEYYVYNDFVKSWEIGVKRNEETVAGMAAQ